jgi:hypothetical protein
MFALKLPFCSLGHGNKRSRILCAISKIASDFSQAAQPNHMGIIRTVARVGLRVDQLDIGAD